MEKSTTIDSIEQKRLDEVRNKEIPWKKWGPYLSERQWGTVREDYSPNGDAWNFFTHEQSRSRAYRWGEDGIAGISDDRQRLCFSLALWNGRDPILKERLFGLTNSEGNHGEDVKEYYFYLDSTPTHSYMKYLYKYPQAVYPYADLVQTNGRRSREEMEYELIDQRLEKFYDRLLTMLRDPVLRDGRWQLLECRQAWEGNWTSDCFVACSWTGPDGGKCLVAVNYSDHPSQCYVPLPWPDLAGQMWLLRDRMGTALVERSGTDLASRGLYLDLPAWGYHVFDMHLIGV